MRIFLTVAFLVISGPVAACKLALALAVDISGSVDPEEYGIQMEGLAAGITDPTIGEALVQAEAMILLVQWTGASRQEVSIDWTKIGNFSALEALATDIRATPRAWRNFSTAIGEAILFTSAQFEAVNNCDRLVIDVSGDGVSNEGTEPKELHRILNSKGITVNALVIEGEDQDLTGYFWENVITGEGAFVETANGFSEYAEKMRRKLLKEVLQQIVEAPIDSQNHSYSASYSDK